MKQTVRKVTLNLIDEFNRVNFASSVPTDVSGTRTKILSVLGPTREVVQARIKLVRIPKTLARVG